MKSTYTPRPDPAKRTFPCFLIGKNSKRIVLATDPKNAIVLVAGSHTTVIPALRNTPLMLLANVISNEYSREDMWFPAEGTITIELP